MKTIRIEGIGTDLHLKRHDEEEYETSFYILQEINSITIDGEPFDSDDVEPIEIDDVIEHLGFEHGDTTIMYVYDEDTDEGLPLSFEYNVDDNDEYKIRIEHVEDDYNLGEFFLVDTIEVNGEEIISEDAPDYYGERTSDIEV